MGQNKSKSINEISVHKHEINVNSKCNEHINDKHILNDVIIKVDESYDEMKEEKSDHKNELKSYHSINACDFGCTIFYGMVAMLVFSTLSRTYAYRSGNTCSPVFATQSLLAYMCIGLACGIIRRLRTQIREQVRPLPDILSQIKAENEGNNCYDNDLFNRHLTPVKHQVIEEKPAKNKEMDLNDQSLALDSTEKNCLCIIDNSDQNKGSTVLPLPLLPPPKSKPRAIPHNQRQNINQLSAKDLISMDSNPTTDVVSTHGLGLCDENVEINTESDCYRVCNNHLNATNYPNNKYRLDDINHD